MRPLSSATSLAASRGRYIIGKRFYGIDVRAHGSGNLGATNVFRTLGAKAAIATLVLDVAKGAAAVGFAWWLVPAATYGETAHTWAMIAATMAAILGHSYSPYIGFRGGKGVATAAGALLVLTPYAVAVPAWHVHRRRSAVANGLARLGDGCDRRTRSSALCSTPGNWAILGFACAAASLVVWRHRANIVRIVRGEEPKISFSGRGSAAREKKGDT